MANNGFTASFFDHDRTYLPQLPQNVKNRNMDESRLGMRTSSEEYGRFWINDALNVGGSALPPTYITDPSPNAIAAASRRHQPHWNRSLSNFRYVLDYRRNGSHRNSYDLVNPERTSQPADRPQYQLSPSESRYVGTPLELYGLRNGEQSPEQRVQRHRYRLAIDDHGPATAIGDWTLTDINRVDLRVHLNNDSSVVIDNVPFYFVRM